MNGCVPFSGHVDSIRQHPDPDPGVQAMIPPRTLLLHKLLRSVWSIGVLATAIATLIEWGLIVE